LADSKHKYT